MCSYAFRIAELKDNKENVFKMEREAKVNLLRTVGAIGNASTSSNSQDDGSSGRDLSQELPLDISNSNKDENVFNSPGNAGKSSGSNKEEIRNNVESFKGALNV